MGSIAIDKVVSVWEARKIRAGAESSLSMQVVLERCVELPKASHRKKRKRKKQGLILKVEL